MNIQQDLERISRPHLRHVLRARREQRFDLLWSILPRILHMATDTVKLKKEIVSEIASFGTAIFRQSARSE